MRLLASLCVLTLGYGSTGCFGSFALVHKLYDFNKSFGNKFVQTIVFWVFCIIPVYEVASLGDAVILNLIEFWTGSNPLAMKDGDTQQRVVEAEGKRTTLTFEDHGRTVRIHVESLTGAPPQDFTFRGDDDGAVVVDGQGQLLSQSRVNAAGQVEVSDGLGVRTREAAEVVRVGNALQASAEAAVAEARLASPAGEAFAAR
jgi:hypothetical protein